MRLCVALWSYYCLLVVGIAAEETGAEVKDKPKALVESVFRDEARTTSSGRSHIRNINSNHHPASNSNHERLLIGNRNVCRKSSATLYKTVSVGMLGRLFGRGRRDRAGNCATMCSSLCEHKACMNDYTVTGSSCECASTTAAATPKQCFTNSICDASTDACICQSGFVMNAARTECVDIDECKPSSTTPAVCSGATPVCTNKIGSYTCSASGIVQPAVVPASTPNTAPVPTTPSQPKAPSPISGVGPTPVGTTPTNGTPTAKTLTNAPKVLSAPTLAPRFPTLAPAIPIAPTPVPPQIQALMDTDLIYIAKNATFQPSLQTLAEAFESSRTEERRHSLQQETLAALAAATSQQIKDLINSVAVLYNWNEQGNKMDAAGKTKRAMTCELITQSSTSKVTQKTKDCLCGSVEPYLRCDMWLGNEAWVFRENRRRLRRLGVTDFDETSSSSSVNEPQVRRRMESSETTNLTRHSRREKVDCSFQASPTFQTPNDFNQLITSLQKPDIQVKGTCCMDLYPPPLTMFEVCGTIEANIPNVPWLTVAGAQKAISDGTIQKGSKALQDQADTFGFGLEMKLCLSIQELLKKNKDVKDAIDFLGLDLCFLMFRTNMWPASGSARAQGELKLGALFAKAALLWQMDTGLRDVLGLCDNITPKCGDIRGAYCALNTGEVAGQISLGIDFFLFQVGFDIPIGDAFYRNCDKYNDGTLCLMGTTCNNCRNPATYWMGKAMTACGAEPRYEDGTTCLLGTSCNMCINGATWWDGAFISKCGREPAWADGSRCGLWTTCNNCKNAPTHWWGLGFMACGIEPKWTDGTTCAPGISCHQCFNAATTWFGPTLRTACGTEPRWSDGTPCAELSSCKTCQNGSSYWWSKVITACGQEPKWGDGTVCLPGPHCSQCRNGSTYWWEKAAVACGTEPKWADGRYCVFGSSCGHCQNSATHWWVKGHAACGSEPRWRDGNPCVWGSSCNVCQNGDHYDFWKATYVCGK